jgi:hypothetical protein
VVGTPDSGPSVAPADLPGGRRILGSWEEREVRACGWGNEEDEDEKQEW